MKGIRDLAIMHRNEILLVKDIAQVDNEIAGLQDVMNHNEVIAGSSDKDLRVIVMALYKHTY